MALNAKMVIGFYGQSAIASSAFQYPLGHNNAGWDTVFFHLTYGQFLVLLYVLLSGNLSVSRDYG
jgi:hypothetical protein